ncbi:MAG: arylesterase [Oscillospiraceae bacterium]|nr:arylesterase [Oscillospiraceae bacterium]
MKNILFFGDSNTWGFDPSTTLRYPYQTRWTTACAGILGEDFNCIPAGLNGRTTVFDDPMKGCRNGTKGLDYELQTHKPLDLFVVMLGTNDLKHTDAQGTAEGMERLIKLVLSANERYNLSSPVFPAGPSVLLISPILLKAHVGDRDDDIAESARLSGLYQRIAENNRLYFLDASLYAEPSDIDGVHLGVEGHRALGEVIAEKIKTCLV